MLQRIIPLVSWYFRGTASWLDQTAVRASQQALLESSGEGRMFMCWTQNMHDTTDEEILCSLVKEGDQGLYGTEPITKIIIKPIINTFRAEFE